MDLNYLLMREGVERMRADRAACSPSRDAHLALSRLFHDRIDFRRRILLANAGLGPELRPPRL